MRITLGDVESDKREGGAMSDKFLEAELLGEEEGSQLTRRGLFVTGGLAAAGLTALGSPGGRALMARSR